MCGWIVDAKGAAGPARSNHLDANPPDYIMSEGGSTLATTLGGGALILLLIIVVAFLLGQRWRSIRITELWIYPVKSCGGVRVEEATMFRSGLAWDREFAIVDMRKSTNGEVLSQKQHPRLAKICPTLHCTEMGELPAGPTPGATLTGLTLRTTDTESSVFVDLVDAPRKTCRTTWLGNNAPLDAQALPVADAWLSEQVGFACRLVRLTSRRGLRTTRLAPVADNATDCCRYQDGAPLTVLSEASVSMISRKFSNPLLPARFRANVVISGCGALAESTWTGVGVGPADAADGAGAGIRFLMEAYRCTMITIAQAAEAPSYEAGSRPHGPMSLFKLMRSLTARDASSHGPLPRDNPNLAVFAAPDQDEAVLRVGDLVRVRGTIHEARAPSIFKYNEAKATEQFTFDEEARFWVSGAPKQPSA